MEYKIKQEHNSQNSEPKDTTLWSMDTKGKVVKVYQDTAIFGEDGSAASIEGATPLMATRYAHYTYPSQHNRSVRFTGKPYDEDLQAYVFPYRNYDATIARWRSSDPAGYPDGLNQHFYAAVPTMGLDTLGLEVFTTSYGSFAFSFQAIWDASFDDVKLLGVTTSGFTSINTGVLGYNVGTSNESISSKTYNDTQNDDDSTTRVWDVSWNALATLIVNFNPLFGIFESLDCKYSTSTGISDTASFTFEK